MLPRFGSIRLSLGSEHARPGLVTVQSLDQTSSEPVLRHGGFSRDLVANSYRLELELRCLQATAIALEERESALSKYVFTGTQARRRLTPPPRMSAPVKASIQMMKQHAYRLERHEFVWNTVLASLLNHNFQV